MDSPPPENQSTPLTGDFPRETAAAKSIALQHEQKTGTIRLSVAAGHNQRV